MIYVMDHKKQLMPLALILCVALTVFFAIRANEHAGTTVRGQEEGTGYEVPVTEAVENAYPEVNELIRAYYKAWAIGDTETIDALYHTLDETERLKTVELARYIEDVPEINVYTKPGPVEGTYVVYPYITVKFHDYAENVPGIHALYVCTDENGDLFINSETSDENVKEYIREISLQNDVIDLFSSVSARFNEMKAQDEALDQFLSTMLGEVNITVGEALATNMAAREQGGSTQAAAAASTEEETEVAATQVTTGAVTTRNIIRATDVVNIRTSDSETADKIDKTAVGDEFTQLEARANGWSKIMYEGREAFVKTEFFEVIGTEEVPGEAPVEVASASASTADDTASNAASTASSAASTAASTASTAASTASSAASTGRSTASSAASASSSAASAQTSSSAAGSASTGASSGAGGITGPGNYHVKETTRVRASASTESDILAVAYQKNPIEVVNVQADGWSKVKYEGKTGYVKTEYLTE